MIQKNGFTLIELLIVISMMSIMMAIGLPSFQSIIASTRLTSAANAMVSALQLARAEALKQHKTVVVYKKTTWVGGWNVFVNLNDSTNYTQQIATEPTISMFDALSSTLTVISTYTNYVSYKANGRVNDNGHFTFNSGTDWRCVIIATTGRIRTVAKDTASSADISMCT